MFSASGFANQHLLCRVRALESNVFFQVRGFGLRFATQHLRLRLWLWFTTFLDVVATEYDVTHRV